MLLDLHRNFIGQGSRRIIITPANATIEMGRRRSGRGIYVLFFFQAEDGIRGHCVTGVQTCALPIWAPWLKPSQPSTTCPRCTPKVAVSVHRKLLSAAGMSTHHGSSSSSEREQHDGTGNEQREGAGAVAPTPASNRTMKPVTNVTTSTSRTTR